MKLLINENLKSILKEISDNNPNSKKIVLEVNETINNIDTFFNDVNIKISNYNNKIKSLNDDNNKLLKTEIDEKEKEAKIILDKIDEEIRSLNESNNEILDEIKENNKIKQSELNNQNTISVDQKEQFITELKRITQKNLREIEKQIKDITLSTQEKINIENNKYAEKHQEIKINRSELISDINLLADEDIKLIEQKQNILILEEKNQKKNRDESYVNIRSIYQNASSNFNKQIDKLKKNKNLLIQKQNKDHEKNISPYNIETVELNNYYNEIKASTLNEYEKLLETHFLKLDEIKNTYENAKEKINFETNQSISVINSNYTNLQEVAHQEKDKNKEALKNELIGITSSVEETRIKNKYNKEDRRIDLDLIKQKKYRDQANLKKEQERYLKLKKAESNYIKGRMRWRVEQKEKELSYKKSIDVINSYYNIKTEEINNNLLLQQKILDNELNKIEQLHLLEIAPLQSQLNIASLVQERDINLLNNETSSTSYLTEIELEKLNLEKSLAILNRDYKIEKENIKFDYLTKQESLINQLAVQELNTKKEFKLKHFELAMISLKTGDQITQIEKGIKYKIEQMKLSSSKQLEDELMLFSIKHQHDLLENEIQKVNTKHKLELQKLEQNLIIKNNNLKTELYKKELELLHIYIADVFTEFNNISNSINYLITAFINMYTLVVLPNDLKKYLNFINGLIKEIKISLFNLVADFENEINNHVKLIMENIFLSSKDIKSLKIIDALIRQKNQLDNEISLLNNSLINLNDQLYILEARYSKSIRELKIIDQQRKTFTTDKSLKENSRELQKNILIMEKEMRLIELNQNSLNKKIATSNNNLIKINNKIDEHNNYNKHQSFLRFNFGRIYLSQFSTINRSINSLFTKIFSKITNLNLTLINSNYLTDSTVGYYKNQIAKLNNLYTNKITEYYQKTLSISVLFYDILHDKKEFIYSRETRHNNKLINLLNNNLVELENKNNKLVTVYNHDVLFLKDKYNKRLSKNIINIKNNSKKPLSNLIAKQNDVKNKLNSHEQKLNNELKLINDNLVYSLKNYENDYNKNISNLTNKNGNEITKLKTQTQKRIKNYNITYESLLVKNEQIIKLYQTNYQEQISLLKKTQKDLKQKITQLDNLKQKHIFNNNIYLLQLKKKHKLLNKKHREEFNKAIKEFERESISESKKELKDMEKSINFKLKTLKLN